MFTVGVKLREFIQVHKPLSQNMKSIAYDFAAGESVWQTLKANVLWKRAFDDDMTTRNKLYSVPWHEKYPMEERLAGQLSKSAEGKVTIVDVGGNRGFDLSRFLEHFPGFTGRLVLQDLPETFVGMQDELDERIECCAYDFFTPQPVKGTFLDKTDPLPRSPSRQLKTLIGAEIYYFKSVLHDWNEPDSLKILSQTAQAMNKGSRLLINEMVLADIGETANRVTMDVLMLLISNGMERTLTQWRSLLESVRPGLKIVKIWSAPGDQQSVIEAALRD